MDCRAPIAMDFIFNLGFGRHGIIMTKEQSVLTKVMKIFSGEEIVLQHSVLSYRIDLYFTKYKLAIEVDERNHCDRNEDEEEEREKKIKDKFGCEFIRINRDEEKFDVFDSMNEIQR